MADQKEPKRGVAKALWAKLDGERRIFWLRAQECSKYTIPTLIPPTAHSAGTKYYTPYQSIGARGVNNLASKLLTSLFPANTPFIKLAIDDFTLEELTKQEGMRAQVEEGLNKIERAVQTYVETAAIRVGAFEALKHLVVGGNALIYMPEEGGIRFFGLERYAVRRDPSGNVLDIVVQEKVSPDALPEKVKDYLETNKLKDDDGQESKKSEAAEDKTEAEAREQNNREKTLELYTHVSREEGKWEVYQEINGLVIEGTEGTYPMDKCPWIPLRFTRIDGENYGRSYVEEYLGDIKTLEGLTQAIAEGSAAAARVLFLVNPNGTTRMKDLAATQNGGFAPGTEADVTVLQLQKYNDFRVALETTTRIEERLSYAFMLNSAVQRNGERVTAEEIRFMANELESGLGGIYSILSQEMQLPVAQNIMAILTKKGKMPSLPKGAVTPVVVTGIEALGRGNDLQKLQMFVQTLTENQTVAQAFAQYANVPDLIKRVGTAIGIDMKGLIKSPDQVQQEMAAQQQAAMLQQGLPNLITAGGKLIEKGMDNGQGQPQSQG